MLLVHASSRVYFYRITRAMIGKNCENFISSISVGSGGELMMRKLNQVEDFNEKKLKTFNNLCFMLFNFLKFYESQQKNDNTSFKIT